MKRIWLIFRVGIYPIMHVCLSIPAQLCCKIKILSFWVHLNAIPTCEIITNLSWPPILQDIINNHASVRIVLFRYFLKPYFIETMKESWRYMLLALLQSEKMWNCVYLIWSYPDFSMIFIMKCLIIFQWYFLNDTWKVQ